MCVCVYVKEGGRERELSVVLTLFYQVVQDCSEVLKHDSSNTKALFRRGRAHLSLHDYAAAVSDLKKAKALVPQDKSVATFLTRAKKSLSTFRKKESEKYRRMFQ